MSFRLIKLIFKKKTVLRDDLSKSKVINVKVEILEKIIVQKKISRTKKELFKNTLQLNKTKLKVKNK